MRNLPTILLVAALAVLPLWGAGSTAASQSCSFVSSAATQAYHGDALLPEGHDAVVRGGNQEWEDIPAGPAGTPSYIWATTESEKPLNATFVHKTGSGCGAGLGTLYINVDNDGVAYWNGVPVWACRDTPLCFQDSYQVSILFVPGVNTLTVYAQNDCCWGSTYVNPAMLQFRVDGPQ